jgi:hypothetical protein
MRRALALAHDYAARRHAFGRRLIDHPLHAATLAALDDRYEIAFHLAFQVVELLGRDECGEATEDEQAMLRLLTPVAKLFTAKEAVAVASEVLESFGGAGYVEDTGLPRLLRDAQVLPIWEGTTNVLSLDVWRAIERTDALRPWIERMRREATLVRRASLAGAARSVLRAVERIEEHVFTTVEEPAREVSARRLAFAIARTVGASGMLAFAEWEAEEDEQGKERSGLAAARAALGAESAWEMGG